MVGMQNAGVVCSIMKDARRYVVLAWQSNKICPVRFRLGLPYFDAEKPTRFRSQNKARNAIAEARRLRQERGLEFAPHLKMHFKIVERSA